MLRLLAAIVAAWVWLSPALAAAQEWPSKPVRIIIPLGPGGGGDVFTRLMAEELQKHFGQPFIVENRPGGGLNIGSRACAAAVLKHPTTVGLLAGRQHAIQEVTGLEVLVCHACIACVQVVP